jgi:hypothetical protein
LANLLADANANTNSADAHEDDQESEHLKASDSSVNSKALSEQLDMLGKGANFLRLIDLSSDLGQQFHKEHM